MEPEAGIQEEDQEARPTIRGTVSEVISDTRNLIQAEILLTKGEIDRNVVRMVRSVRMMLLGAVFLLVAVVFLTVAGMLTLAEHVGLVPALWAVGGGSMLLALVLGLGGKRMLSHSSFWPAQSIARIAHTINQLSAPADSKNAHQEEQNV